MKQKMRQNGFTIVELLIVIVVIGVLAALVINNFTQAQEKARQTKIDTDLGAIEKAIKAARIAEGDVAMRYVTGSTATGGGCWGKAANTDLAQLPRTDGCWVAYDSALNTISIKSGTNIRDIVDPWGNPYMLDENEQESGPTSCTPDRIGLYKRPIPASGYGNAVGTTRAVAAVRAGC